VDRVDCLVVGAGVVGLAVARALAQRGREVLIAESEPRFGSGISSRNSEVVHAGLYYTTGSLKARACVQGKQRLYALCHERGVAHRRCGKLVVAATPQEWPKLQALQAQALANGVSDTELLSTREANELEPALQCAGALWSPSSGIVDSHALMTVLLADAQSHGALLGVGTRVERAQAVHDGWVVTLHTPQAAPLHVRWLINCAGLYATELAARMQGYPAACLPRLRLAKGNYFSLAARSPFSHLIYPLPDDGGLGVHLTLDLQGQARFGPDVQWLGTASANGIDYAVDTTRASAFREAITRYWPGLSDLPSDALTPAYSGVRPKLSGPGEAAADFCIQGPGEHGCAGLVQMLGIESPGLTACLALGDQVAALAQPPSRRG
jgi:L-2-hydroxyglutarate oxidase LhgO